MAEIALVPPVAWSDEAAHGMGDLELLMYRSHLLGGDPALTNPGGGNTSTKRRLVDFRGREVDALTVKATGADLKDAGLDAFVDVSLADLLALRDREQMSDAEMVDYLAHCLLDPAARRPSIETLLHGFLPARCVDHIHPDLGLALATAANGETVLRELFGEEAVWVPYVRPGFTMALLAARAVEASPRARFAVLQKHGLLTWAEDARTCYLQNVEFLARIGEYVQRAAAGRHPFGGVQVRSRPAAEVDALAAAVMPALRGELSRDARCVVRFDRSPEVMDFVNSAAARGLAETGLACPDHVLYTGLKPLFLDLTGHEDAEAVAHAAAQGLTRYEAEYRRFFEAYRQPGDDLAPPLPRIVLAPGLGMFAAGKDVRSARIAAQNYRQAIRIMAAGAAIGSFTPLAEPEAYDIEYWPLELYKLTLLPPEEDLSRRIALITGGAGAIGRAIAARFVRAGACVAVADLNLDGARETADALCGHHGEGAALAVALDVTDETSVRAALEATVLAYGGLDVLVCNAGIAFSHALEETSLQEWSRTMEVLATGYFLTAREGIRVMRRQRTLAGRSLGGSVIFVASKAGLAAARNASAYASAKAATLHLARCIAEEAAGDGIRVNSLAPDAIIQHSGLWAGQWGAARAEAHGVPLEKLADFYRGRNLLQVGVTAEDVAEAALFFASDRSRATTGGILSVDGGLHDGYVR